jgi:hypothetical protein
LPSQRSSTLASSHYLAGTIPDGCIQTRVLRKRFRVTQYYGEQVIEVMSHPARKPAYRLHLLSLLQLQLEVILALLKLDCGGQSIHRIVQSEKFLSPIKFGFRHVFTRYQLPQPLVEFS